MNRGKLSSLAGFVMTLGLLVGCGVPEEAREEPGTGAEIEPVADLQVRVATPEDKEIEAVRDDESSLLGDCVYVQWCDAPGPDGTVCRLRTGCKLNSATRSECVADSYAVCGKPVSPWKLYY